MTACAVGLLLTACSTAPPRPPEFPGSNLPSSPLAGERDRAAAKPAGATAPRPTGRWVAADWAELPGWAEDPLTEALPALLRSCTRDRAPTAWREACAAALLLPERNEAAVRTWAQEHLRPWRVESTEGQPTGLLTGYYEPEFEAHRRPDATFRAALHAPPRDLSQRRPHWSRQELDTLPQAQAALRDLAIAHLADPVDVLVLQIQGSGRLRLTEPDGRERLVRLAYAGHNDHPYRSVGRWLVDQGQLTLSQASWPGIRDWTRRHPQRVQEMLWANPRVIYFREEPLPDPSLGPRGAQGVPLTPERSIAVDPRSIPYGTPVWLDSSEPLGSRPLRRLVVAQDTGSAIVGAVRADYFWGWGERAEAQAGRTKQPLRLWALWPRGSTPAE